MYGSESKHSWNGIAFPKKSSATLAWFKSVEAHQKSSTLKIVKHRALLHMRHIFFPFSRKLRLKLLMSCISDVTEDFLTILKPITSSFCLKLDRIKWKISLNVWETNFGLFQLNTQRNETRKNGVSEDFFLWCCWERCDPSRAPNQSFVNLLERARVCAGGWGVTMWQTAISGLV